MIYVQNLVFRHCARETLLNNSQEYAGLQKHLTRLVQETQQYREMFDESRATQSQPLDQNLNDFDKDNQNFCEKYGVKIMTEQQLMLYDKGIGQPGIPRIQILEDQQIIGDLRSEVMQMRASAEAPNLNQKSWSQD